MEGPQRSWADLPLELAGLVLGRLPSHLDRLRFAAVCPQWRSAAWQVRLPPPPPLLALKNGRTFYNMPTGEPLRVRFPSCDSGFPTWSSREDSDFLTASGNWLVYRQLCGLLLLDPFSGATMTLPAPSSITYKSDVPSVLAYQFEVIKLIVCSPDLIAALFWTSHSNRIAVCRPGASLWSVAWDLSLWITDMAFYQGKLYALDYGEELLALDINVDDNTGDPQVAQIGQVIKANYFADPFSNNFNDPIAFKRMLYLVELQGSLLLVRRSIFRSHVNGKGQIHTFSGQCEPEVAVFEADFAQSRWAKMTSLGDDQALFLGPCSRAVCMPQCDSSGNRVWFLDEYKDFHPFEEYMETSSSSDTSGMAYHHKPFSPFPMISW
ncbi:unnamed protein product [Urochloa decumbens]|uniref:KIB1-4 beta-propeller domain-containing protein n=1 Tax=Urochloa decumbens TaxID=240449 RepID=A0ABC9AMG9_9POAL